VRAGRAENTWELLPVLSFYPYAIRDTGESDRSMMRRPLGAGRRSDRESRWHSSSNEEKSTDERDEGDDAKNGRRIGESVSSTLQIASRRTRRGAVNMLGLDLLAFETGNLSILMEPSVSGVGVRPG